MCVRFQEDKLAAHAGTIIDCETKVTENENATVMPASGTRRTASDGGNGSKKLRARDLRRIVLEQTKNDNALVAEPLDSGLWPTEGLSPEQRKWIGEALRRVPRSALTKNAAA